MEGNSKHVLDREGKRWRPESPSFFSYAKDGCHPQEATIYPGMKLKTMTPKPTPFLNTRSQKLMSSFQLSIFYDSMIWFSRTFPTPSAAASMGDILILSLSFYHPCIWLLLFIVCFPKLGYFYNFAASAHPHSALSSQNKLSRMLFCLFFASPFGANKEPQAPWGSGCPVCVYIAAGRRPALILQLKPQMLQNGVRFLSCFTGLLSVIKGVTSYSQKTHQLK